MKFSKNLFRKRQNLRSQLKGTAERPRLSIFRSNKYIYVQIINDLTAETLISHSTNSLNFKKNNPTIQKNSCVAAEMLGKNIAKDCLEKNITKIIFDRGSYIYHGKIKALAESARLHGLKF
jgi:large subunit ribosomal protein L18